ncbi:MAG TPA: hypothetical protein DCE47_08885 [Planctomycetaceae bacterium]|nr:hypothetical protein [Planctomycetaceae bacterium]HCD01167.1 hypothetical protein [Planctomycetaceae bacterium]
MSQREQQPTTSTPNPPKRLYVRAVTPGLRKLLWIVFVLVALLSANAAYLSAITGMQWVTGEVYQTHFYFLMLLGHIVVGLLLVVPLIVFGGLHIRNAHGRSNRRAVRVGYVLFAVSIAVLVTGFALVRVENVIDLKHPLGRNVVYWLHVALPLIAGWLYWLHRLAGPRIKWHIGGRFAAVSAIAVVLMVAMHSQDPRQWNVVGSDEGVQYFEPSLARTTSGKFIPREALMMDSYCKKCHPDTHAAWSDSVHRFSSFNNAAYLPSVRETRKVSFEHDGNVRASRWCAGCHDPVPFFSGAFDQKDYDDVNDPTAHAGVTCTVCHAITHINSNRGNSDYTIEEPLHYPFAYSDNPVLQWINNQLVKAKPDFHKKTFLKPHHKTTEFCSVCHKVHLPLALNKFKQIDGNSYQKSFIRGQNHYDAFLLSGLGHGASSFYYPPKAETNCNRCHMPLVASNDFGARPFGDSGQLQVHNHLFPGANTGIAWFRDRPQVIASQQEFLAGTMRVDLFGIRDGGGLSDRLHAPLRPAVPTLKAGTSYLLDAVIRTVKLGHLFTQGTVDSNEVWLEVTVRSGDRVIGASGKFDADREVDPWSHFVNVFLLDVNGRRIDRRNPQDIFTPLYNHQIPPGAGQVVHYQLELPRRLDGPITVEVKLNYRKFDKQYTDFIARNHKPGDRDIRGLDTATGQLPNQLPVTVLAVDRVTFPVEGDNTDVTNDPSPVKTWVRWNDYGIGLFLKGKSELRQAGAAFAEVEKLSRYDGPLNLARVLFREGRLNEAAEALARASKHADPAPPAWTIAWLSGLVARDLNQLEKAEKNFRSVIEDRTTEMARRGFDFSKDYRVVNLLGQTYFDRARQLRTPEVAKQRKAFLEKAVETFHRALAIDSENVTAHYNLQQLYRELGDNPKARYHTELHAKFKPDDNARDQAVGRAKARYPAANAAAEEPVFYRLQRPGAPGLPSAARDPDGRRQLPTKSEEPHLTTQSGVNE